MQLTFKTRYDMSQYASTIVMPKLPNLVTIEGYICLNDVYNPKFKANIGDYILLEWTPNGVCTFNKYGAYGNDNPMDNLRAEDLKIDMFRQAVGDSFSPCSVEDKNETIIRQYVEGVGWNDKMFQLVHKATKAPVYKDEIIVNFRGEVRRVMGGSAPHKSSSSGYVDTSVEGVSGISARHYAHVYDLEWIQLEEKDQTTNHAIPFDGVPKALKDVKHGEYIKLTPSAIAPVWIKGDYHRSSRTYGIHKFYDVCKQSFRKGTTIVYVGFTF